MFGATDFRNVTLRNTVAELPQHIGKTGHCGLITGVFPITG
jgi:hypothetical protein